MAAPSSPTLNTTFPHMETTNQTSDTVSNGSSSGLATMSTSSTDNLPCSSSSSDSSTCCSNPPTMTGKTIDNIQDEQLQSTNSDSTLTKLNCNIIYIPSNNPATPKRGGSSSARTISSSSNTGSSSSSSFIHPTYVDVAVQTNDVFDEEVDYYYQSQPSSSDLNDGNFLTPQKSEMMVPLGMGTLSGGVSNFSCATSCSQILCTPLRTIVSQNRRRYLHDGFNLDLTYITDRIIAMGYPADTTESLYRNSMSHIVKFLEHYHPGHYKVFNLRGQYVYDTSKFHNRVVSFEMTDHHPPRLELMAPFCREVHEYLETDPRNVVAVHCKAGKGRTGVMICAYLCYINFYNTPRQNMDYYSIVRTHNNKGVTIPSQRRYVYYFNHLRQKKLNYMPLKVELVGIYIEKPPKVSGAFSKGALKVRVANGDVDVFDGEDLWISNEMYDEEDRMHKKCPVMAGNDHYDPNNPKPGNECISRRCYGWTVPPNKRVFIEGDVRVDLYHKSQIKVLNVKQDRKKIGHVWFNTFFSCRGFSNGQYIHGDEQYQYVNGDPTIVKRRLRRKGTTDTSSSTDDLYYTSSGLLNQQNILLSSSVPSSSPVQFGSAKTSSRHGGSVSPLALNETNTDSTVQNDLTPTSTQQKRHRLPLKINGLGRKRPDRSPISKDSGKEWTSQDTGLSRFSVSSTIINQCANAIGKVRTSIDNSDNYVEEFEVEKPPGLDRHCPESTLKLLHPYEKHPPRIDIEEMLKDAGRRNLISDIYNTRCLSVPKEGPVMPKSDVGRPNADGPYCLMRNEREHVSVYGTLEVDRAHKKKDLDMGFKVFIVTKCIDESIPFESQLANQFVQVSRRKQAEKDKIKREKAHNSRQKHDSSSSILESKLTISTQTIPMLNENNADQKPEGMIGNMTTMPSTLHVDGEPDFDHDHVIPECDNPLDDARNYDPHLSKYFFRQRVSSQSRHPNMHYHCPLIPVNQAVCARYACLKRGSNSFVIPRRMISDPLQPLVKRDNNCYKVTSENEGDSCFEESENGTSSLSEEENGDTFGEESLDTNQSSRTNSSKSGDQFNDSESELSVTELQQRSDTMTVPSYAQCKQGNQVAVVGAGINSHSKPNSNLSCAALLARDEVRKKISLASMTSVSSRELIAQIQRGDCHPDSQWCSSTSSSCQSLPEGS